MPIDNAHALYSKMAALTTSAYWYAYCKGSIVLEPRYIARYIDSVSKFITIPFYAHIIGYAKLAMPK